MKLNKQATTHQLTQILPISKPSIIRLSKSSESGFPEGQRIGRINYFESKSVYDWLDSRASIKGAVQYGDKLIDVAGVCDLLGRSMAWVWATITKDENITKVNLSPEGNSKNPRRYFIEREIIEGWPGLVRLAEQREAA